VKVNNSHVIYIVLYSYAFYSIEGLIYICFVYLVPSYENMESIYSNASITIPNLETKSIYDMRHSLGKTLSRELGTLRNQVLSQLE
jgi:hypothetical protein